MHLDGDGGRHRKNLKWRGNIGKGVNIVLKFEIIRKDSKVKF